MNKSIASTSIGLFAVLLVLDAGAQDGAPMPTPVIEIYGCNFTGSNDMDDWNALETRFNTWADRNNVTSYTAFTLTPYLYSDQLTYDVLWLGAWPNGAAMAKDEATYFSQGRELAASFEAIVDCSTHAQFAEVNLREPAGPPPETNGIAMFSDCTLHEGRGAEEGIEAIGEWGGYLAENGLDPFAAVLFALAGESDEADYTFKTVLGFDSIASYGRYTDVYTGGGFMRAEALMGRVMDCDSPRLYLLDRVRLAATE